VPLIAVLSPTSLNGQTGAISAPASQCGSTDNLNLVFTNTSKPSDVEVEQGLAGWIIRNSTDHVLFISMGHKGSPQVELNMPLASGTGGTLLIVPSGSYHGAATAFDHVGPPWGDRSKDHCVKFELELKYGLLHETEFTLTTGVGAVGVSSQGAQSQAPTVMPAAPPALDTNSIQQQIDQIRNGPHEAMPPGRQSKMALGGQSGMRVENGTEYTLSVFFSGPATQKVDLLPGASQVVRLPPGKYEVAARVSDPSVIPYYGEQDYVPNTQILEHFYIAPSVR
jgi:hypothetical protein